MSNQNPLQGIKQAFETQMALKNDSERKYHELASKFAVDIVEMFRELYPGVGIEKTVLREKSGKSLRDKISSLQIERFSKLAVAVADIPDIVREAEINKYGSPQPLNFKDLYPLFASRMDENITPADDSEESIEAADTLGSHYKYCIQQVLCNSIQTPADADKLFEEVADIFTESRISKNTKTALARIMYAKIKLGILPDYYKKQNLEKLSRLYGEQARDEAIKHATSDTLRDAECLDYLNLSEILPIEQDQYDLSDSLYDNAHTSKLDRLIDEQEFLHAKDLQGMQIILTSVPRNFKTKNIRLQQLISDKNHEQDAIEIFNKSFSDLSTLEKIYIGYLNSEQSGQKDKPNSEKVLDTSQKTMAMLRNMIETFHAERKISDYLYNLSLNELKKGLKFERGDTKKFPSYIKLDQACMSEISREFSEHMEKRSSQWLQEHGGSLLVRDSFKHKNKPNGYVAEHMKIEMEGNPFHTLEIQLKSKYVDAKCKPGQSASHAARIGKQRITPTLLDDPYFSTALLNPDLRATYMKLFPKNTNVLNNFMTELDYLLPRYTVIEEDPATHKMVAQDLTTVENATLFYDDLIVHDHTNAQRILQLIEAAEGYGISIPTSPKSKNPPAQSRPLLDVKQASDSNTDPDDPEL